MQREKQYMMIYIPEPFIHVCVRAKFSQGFGELSNMEEEGNAAKTVGGFAPVDCTADKVLKMNIDEILGKNQNKGAVVVASRDDGRVFVFRGAYAVVFDGRSDPEILEALACREALALAFDIVVKRVQVANDFQSVVRSMKEGTLGQNFQYVVRSMKDGTLGAIHAHHPAVLDCRILL
jgi:hypothetical protein